VHLGTQQTSPIKANAVVKVGNAPEMYDESTILKYK
jgi:hypothetical protein